MQTSQVLSQRHWPLAGDTDDCWVLATYMATAATLPWLELPTVRAARAAAGDPDDGNSDGGNVTELVRMIRGLWPVLDGHIDAVRGGGWTAFTATLAAGHPVSVAVDSSQLPAGLQYGFKGAHQVAVVQQPNGKVRFGNPLAAPHSRWDVLDGTAPLRGAIMGYGKMRDGDWGAWGVFLPTMGEAFKLHPLYVPADTAALEAARVAGYQQGKRAALRAVEAI